MLINTYIKYVHHVDYLFTILGLNCLIHIDLFSQAFTRTEVSQISLNIFIPCFEDE